MKFTNMTNRLQQFLELENLTPARLADILGVQRSGLSHILSGRNKPGYDFIYKLLVKFPELSADWFLTGKGKPYKQREPCPAPPAAKNKETLPLHNGSDTPQRDLFDPPYAGNGETYENTIERNEAENHSLLFNNEEISSSKSGFQPNENAENANPLPSARKIRKIKRVTIFYDDGSFEEFFH